MGRGRILICESEGVAALNLQRSLHNNGYEAPVVVSTGEEAVQAAFSMKPALIITEIHLQGSADGIEAITMIMNHMRIPVIYITADVSKETLERSKLTHPHGYLVKPFSLSQLLVNIEISLHKHSPSPRVGRDALHGQARSTSEGGGLIEFSVIGTPFLNDSSAAGYGNPLPICSCCKQIRDSSGSWIQLENYFRTYLNIRFTHSLCPGCVTNLRH